ncbi:MAG TPA: YjbH domain-containing protein [Longimicrobium sp.]|nr:YjbH domain-containing protein [Longimicrobium sp.]
MPDRSARFRIALAAALALLRAAPLGAQEDSAPDSGLAAPEAVEARATRTLARAGFANVAAAVEGSRVVVTFDNARYRDERRALREAARLLAPELGAGQGLVLVPAFRGVPLLSARYDAAGEAAEGRPVEVSMEVAALPAALASAPRASVSFGRADVVVHPWFEARFGDVHDAVESRTGVAPELRVALRRGLGLSAQLLFTLDDELETGESRVRPALVTLNQTARLPRNVFVSATAGAFTPDRYGVDVEGRAYSADGRWSAGAELALTGGSSFAREGWRFAPMRAPTALADVAWRSARYDLTVRATAGAFLADQRGVRLDVLRQFGELEVGWFGFKGGEGANGGFTLRLPLPFTRHAMPGPVRLRAADAFPWQYRYVGLETSGRRFRTGASLEELGRRWNPDFLSKTPEGR